MENHYATQPPPASPPLPPPSPVTGNRFLDLSFTGNSHPLLYLGSLAVTFIAWMFLGAVPLVALIVAGMAIDKSAVQSYLTDPNDFSRLPFPFTLVFIFVILQFVIGIVGLWFTVRFFHKRPFTSAITGFPKFRFGRYFAVTLVTLGLIAIFNLVYALVDPANFQNTVNWKEWLIFLPFALLMLPFQTACEEFFFRGLMLQWFHRMMPGVPLAGVLLSSVCFGLMHSLNPEVESFGFFSAMGSYMLMGVTLAILAVVDEGLELPSAFHFANNLFSFTILGYTNMVLPSPCLFTLKEPLALMDYVSTVLIFFVLILVFCRKQGHQFKVLLKGIHAAKP